MTVKLVNQKRRGLFAEHKGVASLVYKARATIPAIEALQKAGATVEPLSDRCQLSADSFQHGYRIILGDMMPEGIVAIHLNQPPYMGLRLAIEPPYPGEFPDYWRQVDFTPCPVCAAPVVWYEAGYVPGYRVCTNPPHHHSLAK